ncbi:hypothetical protein [Fructobacillus tropaeoli]|uniref:hypothetical protein n=1 Tax=Fructobacillus tropaeoli TaxID=709323 RepID=UPI0030C87914
MAKKSAIKKKIISTKMPKSNFYYWAFFIILEQKIFHCCRFLPQLPKTIFDEIEKMIVINNSQKKQKRFYESKTK